MANAFQFKTLCVIISALAIIACTKSTKLLKEPEPLVLEKPLQMQADDQLTVALDWVIAPNGPGSWVKHASWDEYVISVQPSGACIVEIDQITVLDGLNAAQQPREGREALAAASRDTYQRFRAQGVKPVPGAGVGTVVASAAVAGGALFGAEMASLATLGAGGTTAVATGAAGGAVIIGAPIVIVSSLMRAINHGQVDREIALRQTKLPLALASSQATRLHVLLPVTPAPQKMAIDYHCDDQRYSLTMDVSSTLGRLHLPE